MISTDLTWNTLVLEQSCLANKLLGCIMRNTVYSKHHREEGNVLNISTPALRVRHPDLFAPIYCIKLIAKLGRIPANWNGRRATKFILHLPFSSFVSYASRLQSLSLLLLCYWHEFLDLVFYFKMVNNLVIIDDRSICTTQNPQHQTNRIV